MRKIRIFAGFLFGLMLYEAVYAISLQDAEKLALLQAPELKQLNEQQQAYSHLSIGQSQWRDPELEIGLMNLPSDTFRFNQENMTQFKVGLKQMLPKGDSLKFKRTINQLKAKSIQSQTRLKKLEILKSLRSVWVERFYWRQVRTLLLKQQATFSHLMTKQVSFCKFSFIP